VRISAWLQGRSKFERLADKELMRPRQAHKIRPHSYLALLALIAAIILWLSGRPRRVAADRNPAATTPDLILVNGKILTVDANDSIAEAVAIAGGKIIAVGSNVDVAKLSSATTRVIDLHGRTASPGLIDSHGHFADGGVSDLYDVKLSDATSVAEIVRRVGDRAATSKPGDWILGSGWDEGKLKELRYVTAADLDKVASKNPVWLTHTTGHYGAANSYALKLAHISAATKNPPAGTIDRDPQGAPTGVLKEDAMNALTQLIPPTSPEHERSAILHMIDALHQEGMTAVKEADIQPLTWNAYRQLLDDGKLTIRVFTLWHAGSTMDSARAALAHISALPKAPDSLGNGRLFSGGAKIYMDGSGGARTAWVYQDWHMKSTEIDTGNKGYPSTDPEIYRQEVRLFHQASVHVGTHAVGDRAIDWVVDTYAQVLKEKPSRGLRHSIIHANIPTDHALRVMARLENEYDAAYPEAQAPFLWWIGDIYAANFGPERGARLIPLKTYFLKGIHWGGGSDFFVTPFPARYGLWASVARETLKGVYGYQPFGTTESVDIRTALRSYTIWSAHQLFLDDKVGSIEPGKEADIAIWDRDLYTIPANEVKDLKCEMTLFSGQIVYKAQATPITVKTLASSTNTTQ
jgi:predicted amidohydrolase YtcJ